MLAPKETKISEFQSAGAFVDGCIDVTVKIIKIIKSTVSHRIHVWYIYLHLPSKSTKVGRYRNTPYMDGMSLLKQRLFGLQFRMFTS